MYGRYCFDIGDIVKRSIKLVQYFVVVVFYVKLPYYPEVWGGKKGTYSTVYGNEVLIFQSMLLFGAGREFDI